MHPENTFRLALTLIEEGLNDCEIGRRLGVPRRTVLDWRSGRRKPRRAPTPPTVCDCDPSDTVAAEETSYAYLLGLYLGDGCISQHPGRYVTRLRYALDAKYPRIIDECIGALRTLQPGRPLAVYRYRDSQCIEVSMYGEHWPCLIPQYGPGRKHLRRIALDPWQAEIVERHARSFIRGLIHSDGCRFEARERSPTGRVRVAPRYVFSNLSEDIKGLFCDALDSLEIDWTRPSGKQIAIYRKRSVAILDWFVGPKA